MTRRLVNMRLPVELLARVDARAGELGQTRTEFVRRALEEKLENEGSAWSAGERTAETASHDRAVSSPFSQPASPRASGTGQDDERRGHVAPSDRGESGVANRADAASTRYRGAKPPRAFVPRPKGGKK